MGKYYQKKLTLTRRRQSVYKRMKKVREIKFSQKIGETEAHIFDEIYNKMESTNGEPNCGIKIRNDLFKADEPDEMSKNMVKSETVQIKVEETIAEIHVETEINEEFPLKENGSPKNFNYGQGPHCLRPEQSLTMGKYSQRKITLTKKRKSVKQRMKRFRELKLLKKIGETEAYVFDEIHNKMESINIEPNCGIKIRNDLFKADEPNEISKNMIRSEQVQEKVEETIAEINVEKGINEEFLLKENDMPISLKENLTETKRKVSVKSWKDKENLESAMINNHEIKCESNYDININEESWKDMEKLESGLINNHEIKCESNYDININEESWKDMEKLESGLINKHEIKCEPNHDININEEIRETNDILLKECRTEEKSKDNDIYEQFLSKYEDAADNFCIKKEITDELIVKNEPCIFENDNVNMQEKQSYNNDIQLIGDAYIPEFCSKTKNDNTLKCENCELAFSSPIYLKKHKTQCKYKKVYIANDNNVDEYFKCHVCGMIYSLERLWRLHLMTKHSICNVYYASTSKNTESHPLTALKKVKEKKHKCDICEKAFLHKSHLNKHTRTHTQERPYLCDICKKGFYQAYGLKRHKLTHNGERPYLCDICKKGFMTANALKRHELVHNGERPFSCDICGKHFGRADNFNIHKRIHNKERPISCDICKKKFNEAGDLKRHKSIHNGDRPFSCDVCQKGFIKAKNLKKHRLIHSGD